MRDEGAVGALDEGEVCGLDEAFGGGSIEPCFAAGTEGAVSGFGASSEKEGAVGASDESSEKEGTAIDGAAGFAWGVVWSSLSSSSTLTSGSSLTIVFSWLFLCVSRFFSLSS